MNRPSKKEIKAAIDKLKGKTNDNAVPETKVGKLPGKKDNKRIRKQGV